MKLLHRGLLMLLAAAMLLATAGCDPQGEKPAPSSESSAVSGSAPSSAAGASGVGSKADAPKSVEAEVYYPDAMATKLVAVKRTLDTRQEDKYTAAVRALLSEPKEKGVQSVFPKSAKLRSVKLEGDVAVVDFDSSIRKGFAGGSTGEQFLVGSVVNTLTNFPEVKKVRFLLDGKKIESVAGHVDLTEPVSRMKNLLK